MPIEKLIKRPATTLPPSATCAEAARVMRQDGVGSVIIDDGGRPIGIVTDRDLVVRVMAEEKDSSTLSVGEIMSETPVFASVERGLDQVIEVMRDLAVRRVPIVDEEQKPIGVVSLDDVLILLSEQLSAVAATIRKELGTG